MAIVMDQDAMYAALDLVGRTGAQGLEFGYLNEGVPIEKADWYAHAQYRGARITVEHHTGPVEALEALARRLLDGGMCARCGGLVALSDDGAMAYPNAVWADGEKRDLAALRANPLCRWRRMGPRWEPGCGRPPRRPSRAERRAWKQR